MAHDRAPPQQRPPNGGPGGGGLLLGRRRRVRVANERARRDTKPRPLLGQKERRGSRLGAARPRHRCHRVSGFACSEASDGDSTKPKRNGASAWSTAARRVCRHNLPSAPRLGDWAEARQHFWELPPAHGYRHPARVDDAPHPDGDVLPEPGGGGRFARSSHARQRSRRRRSRESHTGAPAPLLCGHGCAGEERCGQHSRSHHRCANGQAWDGGARQREQARPALL
mmetsp:Transcript_16312/g.53317  ORF Transcript_16312/g.53317 Transcript_16312/m.53317 type:complete len:226 (+) Transcript_16312:472-1149(+)